MCFHIHSPNWLFFLAVQYHANLGQLWHNENIRRTSPKTNQKVYISIIIQQYFWVILETFYFLCSSPLSLVCVIYCVRHFVRLVLCALHGGFWKRWHRSKKWDLEPPIWASYCTMHSWYVKVNPTYIFHFLFVSFIVLDGISSPGSWDGLNWIQ